MQICIRSDRSVAWRDSISRLTSLVSGLWFLFFIQVSSIRSRYPSLTLCFAPFGFASRLASELCAAAFALIPSFFFAPSGFTLRLGVKIFMSFPWPGFPRSGLMSRLGVQRSAKSGVQPPHSKNLQVSGLKFQVSSSVSSLSTHHFSLSSFRLQPSGHRQPRNKILPYPGFHGFAAASL